MLPFSKMLLVVFAMVLILPALKSGGFLSGSKLYDDCMDYLSDAGELKCGLEGLGNFSDYDPDYCTLRCQRPGRPKLPDGVCIPGVGVKCTLGAREGLRNWFDGLTKTRYEVLKKWCPYFPKK
uniref:Putative ixodes 10 kDa peptide protein n=1 Tax=Ixodes ricinus TaxID=34613 RepID=A0A0K8RI80_IXORI